MSFDETLRNLTDVDGEVASQLREQLLAELDLPDGWSVEDGQPEQDPSEDWTLVIFDAGYRYCSVFLLAGAHKLQCYVEDEGFTDPMTTPEQVQRVLERHEP